MNRYCCNPNHNHAPGDHRSTDIWAPDRHSSINNTAFSAYAFHSQQIEDLINMLAAAADPNDEGTQLAACRQVGLSLDDCTTDEIDYVEKEIARRWIYN